MDEQPFDADDAVTRIRRIRRRQICLGLIRGNPRHPRQTAVRSCSVRGVLDGLAPVAGLQRGDPEPAASASPTPTCKAGEAVANAARPAAAPLRQLRRRLPGPLPRRHARGPSSASPARSPACASATATSTRHLRQARLPFTVDFSYLEQGIRVRGQWYPVLKMEWVEGLHAQRVRRASTSTSRPPARRCCSCGPKLARRLREAQHGPRRLAARQRPARAGRNGPKRSGCKLIDYDGMWVPALADRPSGEVGHPNYQHPQRLRERTYTPDVDRFPHLVIDTALRALIVGGQAAVGPVRQRRQPPVQASRTSPTRPGRNCSAPCGSWTTRR